MLKLSNFSPGAARIASVAMGGFHHLDLAGRRDLGVPSSPTDVGGHLACKTS
jgi:hypothetical protein